MAHPAQKMFCERVRERFPDFFIKKTVLDCGSLDINGSNKYLFTACSYTGVDVGKGRNVDLVCKIHELPPFFYEKFDTVISTECFEHDPYWRESLRAIAKMLKKGSLFLFTCASEGREEHGTRRAHPASSPLTSGKAGWGDYYRNLGEKDVREVLDVDTLFVRFAFEYNPVDKDLYFWGITR